MWRVFSLGSRPLSLFQACGSPTASFHSYGGLCHPQPVERRPEVGNVENVNLDDSMQELKQHNNCVCVRERETNLFLLTWKTFPTFKELLHFFLERRQKHYCTNNSCFMTELELILYIYCISYWLVTTVYSSLNYLYSPMQCFLLFLHNGLLCRCW